MGVFGKDPTKELPLGHSLRVPKLVQHGYTWLAVDYDEEIADKSQEVEETLLSLSSHRRGKVRAEEEVIPSQSTPASGLSGAGMQSHQHTRVKQEGGKPDGKYLSVFLVFLLHQLSSPNSQPLRNKGDN